MLRKLARDEIQELAQTGHNFSQALQESSRVSLKYYIPFPYSRSTIRLLDNICLLVWENIADLNQVGLARNAQRNWTLRDWEQAIRQVTGQPDSVIATLETDDELRLHWHCFSVTPTRDGGWNLKEGPFVVKHYRYRKSAIKAGLKKAGFKR